MTAQDTTISPHRRPSRTTRTASRPAAFTNFRQADADYGERLEAAVQALRG